MRKIILIILIALFGAFKGYTNYYEFESGNGSEIEAKILEFNNSGTIVISGEILINQYLEIPRGILIKFLKDGKFTIAEGVQINYNGFLEAGSYTIFNQKSNGQVYFDTLKFSINPRWFGADTSSLPINEAITSLPPTGGEILFTDSRWVITDQVKVNKDNIIFRSNCNTLFSCPDNQVDGNYFKISKEDTIPVKNITFDGFGFQGNAPINITSNQMGIQIGNLPYDKWKNEEVSERITVKNCSFTKFHVGIFLGGCKDVKVMNCYFENNILRGEEKPSGYGILMESCFNIKIRDNKFVSNLYDRHAIYVSVRDVSDPVIPNRNISITNNVFEWGNTDLSYGASWGSFKNAINVRASNGVIISDNIINGSGIYAINIGCANEDVSDVIVTNNVIRNVRNNGRQGAAINFAYEKNKPYKISNVLVNDNIIELNPDTICNAVGISLEKVEFAQANDNLIKVKGESTYHVWPFFIGRSRDIIVNKNVIFVPNTRIIFALGDSLNNIDIGEQKVSGKYERMFGFYPDSQDLCSPYLCDFDSVSLDFPVIYLIMSDGNGAVNMTERSEVKTNLINSIVSDPSGFKITFTEKFENLNSIHALLTSMWATPYHLFIKTMTDDGYGMIIGIKNMDGTYVSGNNANIAFKLEFD